jgi:beta-glucosidase
VDAEHSSVTFNVKNVGTKYGTEIAEIYARLPEIAGENFNRLVAWDRVPLAAGESKSVTLKIDSLYLSVFDERKKQFVPPHGNYELFVGPSSDRLPLTHTLAMF